MHPLLCSSGSDGADPGDMFGGDPPRQQGDDMPGLALTPDPLPVFPGADRCELHLLIELRGAEQDILQYIGMRLSGRQFHQNTEGQCVMDHRLADVQDAYVGTRQNVCDGGGEAGPVAAGDVDQDDFIQSATLQHPLRRSVGEGDSIAFARCRFHTRCDGQCTDMRIE